MAPFILKRALRFWLMTRDCNLILNEAFGVTLEDSQNACKTLGGVEFFEISSDLHEYAKCITQTLEKTALKILNPYDPQLDLERINKTHAKYGTRKIFLKGGSRQYQLMEDANVFLSLSHKTFDTLKKSKIESKEDLRKWLQNEYSGEKQNERVEKLFEVAKRLLPLSQSSEVKGFDFSQQIKIHTCLWNTIESEEPFDIVNKKGEFLAKQVSKIAIPEDWPPEIFSKSSKLHFQ